MTYTKYIPLLFLAGFFLFLSAVDNDATTSTGNCASLSYSTPLTGSGTGGTASDASSACSTSLMSQIQSPSHFFNCVSTCTQYLCIAEFSVSSPSCTTTAVYVNQDRSTLDKIKHICKQLPYVKYGHCVQALSPKKIFSHYASSGSAAINCNCRDIAPPE